MSRTALLELNISGVCRLTFYVRQQISNAASRMRSYEYRRVKKKKKIRYENENRVISSKTVYARQAACNEIILKFSKRCVFDFGVGTTSVRRFVRFFLFFDSNAVKNLPYIL